MNLANPFKQADRRDQFAKMAAAYSRRGPLLFYPDGRPRRDNSWATVFWRGYRGQGGTWDAASKSTNAYPVHRAGEACATHENKTVRDHLRDVSSR
jgi:hypothetical protein